MRHASSSLTVVLLVAACGKPAPPAPTPTPAPLAAAAAAATPPAGAPAPAPAASSFVTSALGARLAGEAANRPTGGLRAEAVLAALAAVGLEAKTSQCLGGNVGARYCVGGATADGLTVSITEFATAADAVAGRALSQQRFGDRIPNRRQLVRGATMLTLAAAAPTPHLDHAQAAFEALPLP